ncbi:hypothetical protein CsSME_00016715 [Camellia sinensis var. sinensis]
MKRKRLKRRWRKRKTKRKRKRKTGKRILLLMGLMCKKAQMVMRT